MTNNIVEWLIERSADKSLQTACADSTKVDTDWDDEVIKDLEFL